MCDHNVFPAVEACMPQKRLLQTSTNHLAIKRIQHDSTGYFACTIPLSMQHSAPQTLLRFPSLSCLAPLCGNHQGCGAILEGCLPLLSLSFLLQFVAVPPKPLLSHLRMRSKQATKRLLLWHQTYQQGEHRLRRESQTTPLAFFGIKFIQTLSKS